MEQNGLAMNNLLNSQNHVDASLHMPWSIANYSTEPTTKRERPEINELGEKIDYSTKKDKRLLWEVQEDDEY